MGIWWKTAVLMIVGSGRRILVGLHQTEWLHHRRHFSWPAQVHARVPRVPQSLRQVRPLLLLISPTACQKRTPDWSDSCAVGSDAKTETGAWVYLFHASLLYQCSVESVVNNIAGDFCALFDITFGCILALLGLTALAGSKHCKRDEFPCSGPCCLCKYLFFFLVDMSGWRFLLVLAYPGSPGPRTIKRLCVFVWYPFCVTDTASIVYGGSV